MPFLVLLLSFNGCFLMRKIVAVPTRAIVKLLRGRNKWCQALIRLLEVASSVVLVLTIFETLTDSDWNFLLIIIVHVILRLVVARC